MRVLVMYDIVDNRCRRRLADLLESVGVRLQWSVFECTLRGIGEHRRLLDAIEALVDHSTDRVRIYRIGDNRVGENAVHVIGKAVEDPLPDMWIFG